MRKKLRLPAMRESDLRHLLKSHDMTEAIDRAEIECMCCGNPLTWDDIGGIIVKEGALKLVCVTTDCIENAQKDSIHG